MRLNSIKLSGFKSFAEPTHFQLPGQLVGVVGPNGCGKSNIMDAVRWVLGESKASELRGESMQDVIFNGSGQRKPASRASVELVFDNSDARASGQWNQFSEIAVKRVLTRDGTSSYSINNQTVRRRDVQDVFLGTGLGPRAYAIIGQGTISRIIESKPEELRLFLEEAAGVSKYKERRRETENRLKDTRENLVRVEDIVRELSGNLEKLERQAEVATRYHALHESRTLKQQQLWLLKVRDAAKEEERLGHAVREALTALEARTAELRSGEAELETIRQSHYAAGDALHAAQGALADASLEVSRLEERIRYVIESRERAQVRLGELQAQVAQWQEREDEASGELRQTEERLEQARSDIDVLTAQTEEAASRLPEFEDAWRAAQAQSNLQRGAVVAVQQQIQVLAAQSRALGEQRRQLETRRERLAAERRQLAPPEPERLAEWQAKLEAAKAEHEVADARLHALSDDMPLLDDERRTQQAHVNAVSAQLASVVARRDALRALQDKLRVDGKLAPWLAKHGLDALQGLWTRLHVEPGWEPALEAVLRERLAAIEIGRLDTVRAFGADAPPARLAFFAPPEAVAHAEPDAAALIHRLRIEEPGLAALLREWLHGVATADSLELALAERAHLQPGQSLVTREGHMVSAHAVVFYAPDSEQAGLLARAQEIEQLHTQQLSLAQQVDAARADLVRAEAAATDAAQRLVGLRKEAALAQTQAHNAQVEWVRLQQQAQQTGARREQIDAELAEIDGELADSDERRAEGEARFEALDLELATTQEAHAESEEQVTTAERALTQAREQLRGQERQLQEAQFGLRTLQARQAELARTIATAQQQTAALADARVQLEEELRQMTDTTAQNGLQEALALRVAREAALGQSRSAYDDLSQRLKRADEQRLRHEQSLQPLRDQIGRLQLEEQAARLGAGQYLEQLQAASADIDALAASIDANNVRLNGLQAEIDRLALAIEALGAVNLAALEELTSSRERKGFLDAQTADLQDAIHTLEDAIRTIDLETRDLLGNTFDAVNTHFGRMFPVLFGGGQAKLVMTGDEILDSGVQVLAQPPGKKNSTIHLLSGGEKALTAIALVFAIFQLNPAPFCLLDEVDAPLDDANTERYTKLVTEMSQGTQFLFISHNKIAMEMAEQLIGVTMQEQGVSRIVAVDMAAAASLAEAA